ncbi:hypothetical protein EVAR_28999_1 [Eumeta japonica]|uniref:Uncharacterized protein n=1 Tax=Eumeta variegata TaxID=151549 RepID=A0A4C1W2F7_EUMVA|nr:hypothetical protein EVAR_28999_1 [Eumeta japonica]
MVSVAVGEKRYNLRVRGEGERNRRAVEPCPIFIGNNQMRAIDTNAPGRRRTALVSAHVELFDEEQHRLETWRRGAVNHRSTDRKREKDAATLVSAHVELFDEEWHRLETWRTGATYHRSTDRGRETVQRRWFLRMWNSSTKNGTDLRLGVGALLIIARLIVNEKKVQRRWFPRMWNSPTKNGTDLRLGVRALPSSLD